MSGKMQTPPNLVDWEALGLLPPDFTWTFSQASGDIVGDIADRVIIDDPFAPADIVLDENGDIVPTTSPTYQHTIAGWSRKAIT